MVEAPVKKVYKPKVNSGLPIATVKRMAKSKDREIRVGEDSVATIISAAELFIARVSQEAGELAKHAGRKTIQVSDVKIACKKLGYPTE